MTLLTIVIDTKDDGDLDPKLVDPHEVAEDVVHEYNEQARANGEMQVEFVSAEWVAGS
ncbi:MAG TPA: hypothetical protein VMX12_08305 [Acidimicrobiia bacterium]|nr:hypothetical protein [Acidimicrobiia bacterium]